METVLFQLGNTQSLNKSNVFFFSVQALKAGVGPEGRVGSSNYFASEPIECTFSLL